jgi:hypothetical protein
MSRTDVRGFFEKRFIGSWDLPDGRDLVFIIARCEGSSIQGMNGESKRAPLLYFSNVKNKDKPLVLNATNTKTLIKLYGKYVEEWEGKPVALYAARTLAFGEEVDCVRIRPTAPAIPAKAPGPVGLAAASGGGE